MSEQLGPAWQRRVRAPVVGMPVWGRDAPDRIAYAATESGVWQAHVWDRATGLRRQVSSHPVGVLDAHVTTDGSSVVWFEDESGSEEGLWWIEPFEGGGQRRPLRDGLPRGWDGGLAFAGDSVAAAISDHDGFALFAAHGDGPAKELWRSTESIMLGGASLGQAHLGGLSADGRLVAVEHGEHGDEIHTALRVLDATSGEVIGELFVPGDSVKATAWSPVLGDQRLAFVDEVEDFERPVIWDPFAGAQQRLDVPIQSNLHVADWWPDGSAVLLTRWFEGRGEAYRSVLADGSLERLETLPGALTGERVRPDGSIWYRRSSGDDQPRVYAVGGDEVLAPQGESSPSGRPYVSWHFDNGEGDRVHGFYVMPDGEGPFPVVMRVHGGPTWFDEDRFNPEVQALVDEGFAVGMVNYRGSAGYGRAWRDRIIGDIGGPEPVDVNAGLADLVAREIADPSRAVIGGWSWGGYTTLMELGKFPELWICGVAGIPVGDYAMGYEDLSPSLQAYDRALLGGTPDEVPELMSDRNPIVHADRVRVPVLFLIGENDSRSPFLQAMAYVDKLAARDHPHEVYLFGTGHGSNDIEEEIRQIGLILEFLADRVPGVTVPTS
jgi:dipeptidyl aminopeptidase/acylaminoacyl peptidase